MNQFFAVIGYSLFYRPLYNALMAICTLLPEPPSLGLAIILLALGLTLLLLPLRIMRHLSGHHRRELAHAIAAIKGKYANHPVEEKRLTKLLLWENNSAILASIVNLVIQVIIGLTLYTIFHDGFRTEGPNAIYEFITPPDLLSYRWFMIDLLSPHHFLTLTTALAAFVVSTIGILTNPTPTAQDKVLQYALPIGAYLILSRLASGLSLFYLTIIGFSLAITLTKEAVNLIARQFGGSGTPTEQEQEEPVKTEPPAPAAPSA